MAKSFLDTLIRETRRIRTPGRPRQSQRKQKPRFKWGYPVRDVEIAQKYLKFKTLDEETRRYLTSPDYPTCPFHNFVGNRNAVSALCDAAYVALGKENHQCSEMAWGLFGPTSTGKTTMARMMAEMLMLPFIKVSGIKSTDEILVKINETLRQQYHFGLVFMHREGHFELPPMVLFIDEFHDLPPKVVNGLLTAIEHDDSYLSTPEGYTADTSAVCWIVATTESGDLFGPMVNRVTPLRLKPYTYDEVAIMVLKENGDWSMPLCHTVARYSERLPRVAKRIARQMRTTKQANPEMSWDDVADKVRIINEIDEHGMDLRRVAALKALGQTGPLSARNLGYQTGVNCEESEVRKDILPPLMSGAEDQPRLVSMSSRGVEITEHGINELLKRNIEPTFYIEED
jgi:Holliday junction resolvasome RuvABC ATP-dependent DNA helicase subunit